ncbi:MAG TPA: acyl-CoA carboxylase subunit epsilon [Nocardioides sp.]|nr:acyl-CoA carboxylase subunit epsilon [Nocardioides sp.]
MTADDTSVVEEGSLGDRLETTPFLRIVKGEPTPEELAAVVTVLASLGGPAAAPPRPTAEWNTPRRLHRLAQPHGPGGWRASGLPR